MLVGPEREGRVLDDRAVADDQPRPGERRDACAGGGRARRRGAPGCSPSKPRERATPPQRKRGRDRARWIDAWCPRESPSLDDLSAALSARRRKSVEGLEHACPIRTPLGEDLEGRGGLPYRHRGAVEHAASLRRRGPQKRGLEREVHDVRHPMARLEKPGGTAVPGDFAIPSGVAFTMPSQARMITARSSASPPGSHAPETRGRGAPRARTRGLPSVSTSVNRLVPNSSSANAVADPPPRRRAGRPYRDARPRADAHRLGETRDIGVEADSFPASEQDSVHGADLLCSGDNRVSSGSPLA